MFPPPTNPPINENKQTLEHFHERKHLSNIDMDETKQVEAPPRGGEDDFPLPTWVSWRVFFDGNPRGVDTWV